MQTIAYAASALVNCLSHKNPTSYALNFGLVFLIQMIDFYLAQDHILRLRVSSTHSNISDLEVSHFMFIY